jgi:integral membrane protein
VSGALRRYQVMAIVVSIALFVLLFGMVLRYGFGHEEFSKAYSPIHGALYIGYLVTVVDLSRRVAWSLSRTVGVMLAGAVPVLSYVVERRVVHTVEHEHASTLRGAP